MYLAQFISKQKQLTSTGLHITFTSFIKSNNSATKTVMFKITCGYVIIWRADKADWVQP